ncbi:NAD(P)/FAD-dependent oxidoreductase [Dactylosporangium siamense]|uniref:Oxidoreductase n=1 Tax=Dactylosporangium siamense TaxID=685454 RepID=A0A919PFX9_9ACTN|nr:FAD-dependent oxidoreductase [Dactylosporangium siamense]GIG44116.1 oxidoreductase [Dactylosporangium siamense]
MGHPALRDAVSTPFWLDRTLPDPHPPLRGETTADLAVVGGGFSGLWTALLAKERDPGLDVVVLEGRRIGWAATGRNGGFCAASLTHGLANGVDRFPDEIETLEELGRANLDGIEATLRRHGIDCGFERTGELSVATEPWQVGGLLEGLETSRRMGRRVEFLDRDAIRAEVRAATYEAGVWDRDGTAMLDPARLAWGLAGACAALGVRFHEGTRVTGVHSTGSGLRLRTPHGTVTAARVALGTGAFRSPLRRVRPFIVPVYDYALMTEPLTEAQRASIGWADRQGIGDSANQFHYYRLTDDNRILWGGYDAVYYNGGGIRPAYDQRPSTSDKLAAHFFETFPQLDGVRFTHAWGGVVDTCSRFCAFFGTGYAGRLAYAAGFTGLGVGATRFGAQVMLDLLAGEPTPLTRLRMVRSRPVPFPPEPVRSGVIQLTRWSIARADRDEGRRNLWLRTLDRLGLGFDS